MKVSVNEYLISKLKQANEELKASNDLAEYKSMQRSLSNLVSAKAEQMRLVELIDARNSHD